MGRRAGTASSDVPGAPPARAQPKARPQGPSQGSASSDAPAGNTRADGQPRTGPSHRCEACGELFNKSEVLIQLEKPSMDWQEKLGLICFDCWKQQNPKELPYELADWKRMCKRMWLMRQVEAQGHLKRIRNTTYESAREDIEARHPGESRREFRKRIIQETAALAAALATGIARMAEKERGKATQALANWVTEWQKKAEDGTYVPKLEVTLLQDQVLQFASEVVPGVDEYYVCRQRECRILCRNTDWIHNLAAGGGHYLCISCGEQYRPWKTQPGYVKANKCWVIEATKGGAAHLLPAVTAPSEDRGGSTVTASGEARGQESATPTAVTSDGKELAAWQVIPIVWQDTATQVLTNQLKEIMLKESEKVAAMNPEERLPYVIKVIVAKHRRAYFHDLPVTATAKERMANRNQVAPGAPQFSMAHLDGHPTLGCRLGPDVPLDEPMTQEDFLLTFGLCRWLVGQQKANL